LAADVKSFAHGEWRVPARSVFAAGGRSRRPWSKRKRGAHFRLGSPPAPQIPPARVRVRASSPLQRSSGRAIPSKRFIPLCIRKKAPAPSGAFPQQGIPGRRSQCLAERVLSVPLKLARRMRWAPSGSGPRCHFAKECGGGRSFPHRLRTLATLAQKKAAPGWGQPSVGSRQLH
jgi:hypothetical protein